MLDEFALRYERKTGKEFDVAKRHIRYTLISLDSSSNINIDNLRCLAHIVNLATQKLISTKSKAKYYSTHEEDVLDDGLVRAICVKVWCSSFVISGLNYKSF
jgi:hypothetical protein